MGANSTESNSQKKPGEYMWFSDVMSCEEEGPPFKPMWLWCTPCYVKRKAPYSNPCGYDALRVMWRGRPPIQTHVVTMHSVLCEEEGPPIQTHVVIMHSRRLPYCHVALLSLTAVTITLMFKKVMMQSRRLSSCHVGFTCMRLTIHEADHTYRNALLLKCSSLMA